MEHEQQLNNMANTLDKLREASSTDSTTMEASSSDSTTHTPINKENENAPCLSVVFKDALIRASSNNKCGGKNEMASDLLDNLIRLELPPNELRPTLIRVLYNLSSYSNDRTLVKRVTNILHTI